MTPPRPLRRRLAGSPFRVALPVLAQDNATLTTADDVRTEISEAMEGIANHSEQKCDQARATAREASNRLGKRYGALEAGASSARDVLKEGFSDAWGAIPDAWIAGDEDASAN